MRTKLCILAACLLIQAAVLTGGLRSVATSLGLTVGGEFSVALLVLTTVIEAMIAIQILARGGIP